MYSTGYCGSTRCPSLAMFGCCNPVKESGIMTSRYKSLLGCWLCDFNFRHVQGNTSDSLTLETSIDRVVGCTNMVSLKCSLKCPFSITTNKTNNKNSVLDNFNYFSGTPRRGVLRVLPHSGVNLITTIMSQPKPDRCNQSNAFERYVS